MSYSDEAICQEYVRSAIGLKPGCSLGAREQMNFATAYLDGSTIYGSTSKSSETLRTFKAGLLKLKAGGVLPADEHNPNCRVANSCVLSGDERVNHNAGLATLHTLFAREHNRVATQLSEVNPHWDEETIYQVNASINYRLKCISRLLGNSRCCPHSLGQKSSIYPKIHILKI